MVVDVMGAESRAQGVIGTKQVHGKAVMHREVP